MDYGVVQHCMMVLIKAPATQVRKGGFRQVQKREGGEREAIWRGEFSQGVDEGREILQSN